MVWLDCGEPGGVRYAGKTAVMGTGDMTLLGFFLTYGISALVGIKHGDGTATWIAGTLAMPGVQGRW